MEQRPRYQREELEYDERWSGARGPDRSGKFQSLCGEESFLFLKADLSCSTTAGQLLGSKSAKTVDL